MGIFTYVLDRVPPGTVDVVLSYCHYGINDSALEDLLPYLKSKGVGVISASPLAMGLLTESGPPEWHPASAELKVDILYTSVPAGILLQTLVNPLLYHHITCNPVIENSKLINVFYIFDSLRAELLLSIVKREGRTFQS